MGYNAPMNIRLAQIEWQGQRVNSLTPDYILPVIPLDNWPHGRKALHMSDLWASLAGEQLAGMVWMDNDVAADPDDWQALTEAIRAEPAALHTAVVKAWPGSTSRPDWFWSHRPGTLGYPVASQDEYAPVAYVSTCLLWTPARLLDLAQPVMSCWRWEQVDVGLSELALRHDIPARACHDCRPKHLHF